ncbi:MAG: Sec62 family protein translocation protein [Acidobacteriota bacterium]|nr:Sec62 family protein translocation protein [Acidobacteriota bacterium]
MSETETPVRFTEDRIPLEGIGETFAELVDLYGGEVTASRLGERDFALPLRRGMATGGGVGCTISWAPGESGDGTVTLTCNRDIDAPKSQRVALLVAGIIGAVLFMLWPFFPNEKAYGTLAWLGGIIALAVYLMTLRKTSGGLAYDFLQRLAARQRAENEADRESRPSP